MEFRELSDGEWKLIRSLPPPRARVGRAGRGYRLGYKLHLAVDAHSELH